MKNDSREQEHEYALELPDECDHLYGDHTKLISNNKSIYFQKSLAPNVIDYLNFSQCLEKVYRIFLQYNFSCEELNCY